MFAADVAADMERKALKGIHDRSFFALITMRFACKCGCLTPSDEAAKQVGMQGFAKKVQRIPGRRSQYETMVRWISEGVYSGGLL